jgi:hypothetical protein
VNLLHPGARVIDAATGETLTPVMVEAAAADLPEIVFMPNSTSISDIARYLAA